MATNGTGKRQSRGDQHAVPATLPSFEDALGELDKAVDALESGQLELDEALSLFERGMRLAHLCQEALDRAELRVHVLLDAEDGTDTPREAAFDPNAD
ncbi:MAG: exodeoxyribonuclease VII small subunit [Ktedonobacterales bacterium]|jgi:exodeoxyribonuclease VII small subunit